MSDNIFCNEDIGIGKPSEKKREPKENDWLYAESATKGCPRCRDTMKPKNMCLRCGRIVEFYDHEVEWPESMRHLVPDLFPEPKPPLKLSLPVRFLRWLDALRWRR